jgi:N utilization substance protein A
MDVVVEEDQLAWLSPQRSERKLAAELTGWYLNIMTVTEAEEKQARRAVA